MRPMVLEKEKILRVLHDAADNLAWTSSLAEITAMLGSPMPNIAERPSTAAKAWLSPPPRTG